MWDRTASGCTAASAVFIAIMVAASACGGTAVPGGAADATVNDAAVTDAAPRCPHGCDLYTSPGFQGCEPLHVCRCYADSAAEGLGGWDAGCHPFGVDTPSPYHDSWCCP